MFITWRTRLVEESSTNVSTRSCRFPVEKMLEILPSRRGELGLTYLVQVDKGLLQPSCEQPGSLRGLAFV